jgi:hypothetical protein
VQLLVQLETEVCSRLRKGLVMLRPSHPTLLFILSTLLLVSACAPAQPTPDATQVLNQVATSVVLTMDAIYSAVPPTNTPLPTATVTEVLPPTATSVPVPVVTLAPTPTLKPLYSCDILTQSPADDTKFRPGESFDIQWVIVNNGAFDWEAGMYLEYQSGPRLTSTKRVDLPSLEIGEQYKVTLDATVPSEIGRQIMIWAIKGPGKAKNSLYWLCYPYMRIIVEK